MVDAVETNREKELGAPVWAAAVLLVLPALYLASALILRTDAGPFWLWHSGLPGYAYLLDAVNLLNLFAPGHVGDPGMPVTAIAALVLMSAHGFVDALAVTDAVLADPEAHLRAITTVFYALNAFTLVAVGLTARFATGGLIPALLVQSGPFMSTVVVRHGLSAAPDTLLVLTALALAFVTLLALRPGLLERRKIVFAVAFGAVAGFGLAVKVAAAPVFVLPLFLLWGLRPLAAYVGVAVLAFGAVHPAGGRGVRCHGRRRGGRSGRRLGDVRCRPVWAAGLAHVQPAGPVRAGGPGAACPAGGVAARRRP